MEVSKSLIIFDGKITILSSGPVKKTSCLTTKVDENHQVKNVNAWVQRCSSRARGIAQWVKHLL